MACQLFLIRDIHEMMVMFGEMFPAGKDERFHANFIANILINVQGLSGLKRLHQEVKKLVPFEEITEKNPEIRQDMSKHQDEFLPLLVNWYQTKFFKWYLRPGCEDCDREMINVEMVSGFNKDLHKYRCVTPWCGNQVEKAYHYDPSELIHKIREGRCGVWAHCFFIILRALGYHARIVSDITDHTWNEVWSESKQRWLHVDTTEGAVDVPLIYEAGWNKGSRKRKLIYCLAFGEYEVVDVTARYALDQQVTRGRRVFCDESWLKEHLHKMTEELLKKAPTNTIKKHTRSRRAIDIKQLDQLSSGPVQVAPKDLQDRRIRSIQWRLDRGDYKTSLKSEKILKVAGGTSSSEMPLFSLRYNSRTNSYKSSDPKYNSKGWSSLVYEYENIDFKQEHESWGIYPPQVRTYLSRYETCAVSEDGLVSWKFDLSSVKDKWKQLKLFVPGRACREADIDLQLHKYKSRNSAEPSSTTPLKLSQVNIVGRDNEDVGAVALTAKLFGGRKSDKSAWKRAQLFHQTSFELGCVCSLSFKIY